MLSSVAVACVFCERLAAGDVFAENTFAAAFLDAFPLSPGHCLIVPRRHESDFFSLAPEEQAGVWTLLAPARRQIERERLPDGYKVGLNIGEAGGQTVSHAHLHLIPRYRGDVKDPRGGIRWVIPARARYWDQTL
jgi:diadenosine tetraphosphate (Ap4A) HIT family hydrolase